ncbi:unnamed protein product [Brassicogethes aeneus]|uniref:Uncharacterized protein n=1 Tax=Brassicogethes aeneus TaxID=1431903 RepID=A0A9P0BD36_BRAAE|nr:unnamed protein product [Brassicogethes aeneus]
MDTKVKASPATPHIGNLQCDQPVFLVTPIDVSVWVISGVGSVWLFVIFANFLGVVLPNPEFSSVQYRSFKYSNIKSFTFNGSIRECHVGGVFSIAPMSRRTKFILEMCSQKDTGNRPFPNSFYIDKSWICNKPLPTVSQNSTNTIANFDKISHDSNNSSELSFGKVSQMSSPLLFTDLEESEPDDAILSPNFPNTNSESEMVKNKETEYKPEFIIQNDIVSSPLLTDWEESEPDDDIRDPDFEPNTYSESEMEINEDIEYEPEFIAENDIENINPEENTQSNNYMPSFPPVIRNMSNLDQPLRSQSCIKENDLGKIKPSGEIRKGKKMADFCYYCETMVLNFSRHIQRNHSLEIEVSKILTYPPKDKQRLKLLNDLRKKGNYINCSKVCKPVQSLRVVGNKTVPCPNCFGFYSSKILWRHRAKCSGKIEEKALVSAQNLLISGLKIDHQLRNTVFPRMQPDEISLVAKKDPLICAYGARYIKTHRQKHDINVASRKMRELARVLIQLRKRNQNIKSLFDALNSCYFDLIVDVVKIESGFDSTKDVFNKPTFAINMGTSLKQVAELAIYHALRTKNVMVNVSSAEAEANLTKFIRVVETQWAYEISTQAINDLNVNKWNKITIVPLASDLKIMKEHLINKANAASEALKLKTKSIEEYIILLETIYCRALLLNRRRPGELQRLTLHTYENSKGNESNYEEFAEVVSESEKILLKRFKRVVIRGKRGRGVPVLFSVDVQEHIQILLQHRDYFYKQSNKFLFGNPTTTEPITGYKVLHKYAKSSGAKNPSAITSTRLRKHLATLTQLFNMNENDMEQLAGFMGHTLGVHRGNYRLPDDVYQTAKVSKLLILMENGGAAKYKGQKLNDIDINLEENLLESAPTKEQDNISEVEESESESDEVVVQTKPKPKNKRVLVPWTTEQKTIVEEFFAQHIQSKKPPKKKECNDLIKKHPEIFKNKSWLKIKVYVQNKYSKKIK